MNLTKPFNSGLRKWMCKAACPSGGVDPLNPRRWRGERLHHHDGGVCWLFVLLWMDSWCHELIVCKIWFKNNLKMRLTALLFDPPTRAPYLYHITHFICFEITCELIVRINSIPSSSRFVINGWHCWLCVQGILNQLGHTIVDDEFLFVKDSLIRLWDHKIRGNH